MPRVPQDIPDSVLRVVLARGVGPTTFTRLVEQFGGFEDIVAAKVAQLEFVDGIGRKRATSIRVAIDAADPESERSKMEESDAELIVRGDADYPRLLELIPDPPIALWVRGGFEEADQMAVAVVGSRNCTAYGRDQTGRLAALLAQSGLTIVSGGARGIDAEAHRAALRVEGRTIVVLGCGLSHIYPPEHADLFDQVSGGGDCGRGAVVSEYAMSVEPRAEHFPRRNRIISGLSLGVLVVEAGVRSGALITARQAAEDHNREVMALPGRADSPASRGCLQAIKDGWAALVLDHADIIAQLESSTHLITGAIEQQFDSAKGGGDQNQSLFDLSLTDRQRTIVDAIREIGGRASLDDLVAATQVPSHELMAELTVLEIQRAIARDHNGIRLKQDL